MATKEQAAAIAEVVAANLSSEGDARRLQQKLISMPGLDGSDIDEVREISGDETNHALKYEAMYKKYSGIVAAGDGSLSALHDIAQGIDSSGKQPTQPRFRGGV